jgi:membrane-bound metal-dependent hydrolase YbcI (DUF457 family)
MASIGHVLIGMTAARLADRARAATVSAVAFWSAVSLLPDLDVIGFSFGVRYANPWGHRGATHSLAILGEPSESCWSYTSSPGSRRYRRRAVCFARGRVDEIVRRWE